MGRRGSHMGRRRASYMGRWGSHRGRRSGVEGRSCKEEQS